jgi:Phage integrase, N-terminal SAM-like domain
MSQMPISPQRARMIEDMSVRKFNDKTQNDYIRHVKTFSTFLGRSPATATGEDLRQYQVPKQGRCLTGDHQRFGRCVAVFLQGNSQPPRDGPPPYSRAPV